LISRAGTQKRGRLALAEGGGGRGKRGGIVIFFLCWGKGAFDAVKKKKKGNGVDQRGKKKRRGEKGGGESFSTRPGRVSRRSEREGDWEGGSSSLARGKREKKKREIQKPTRAFQRGVLTTRQNGEQEKKPHHPENRGERGGRGKKGQARYAVSLFPP